jgi:alkaline phosphatase D
MSRARLHRRGLIGLGVAGGAGLARAQGPERAAFRHGVASGDPLADRVVLWTRATPEGLGAVAVRWELAADERFHRILRRGQVATDAARDHTVKVDVVGLEPATTYFYRFHAGPAVSPVGRTRTLPAGPTADVVLAVASCQLHPGGLFNAYEAIANLPRVDAVVHLGDYIYEYGAEPGAYGMATGAGLGRTPDPPHEIRSLADYRRRHAQYKSDPDLQAAHAQAPFIAVWDDHETANDSWTGGAQNHQPDEGDWQARKAAALRAYYEWMPIREPAAGRPEDGPQRSFQFGDLASLIMLETRLGARDEPLAYESDLAALKAKIADPKRRLLGARQSAWLKAELSASREAGRPWQVLGNQVIMARVEGPDPTARLSADEQQAFLAQLAPAVRPQVEQMIALFRHGAPFTLDSWDGYPAERERLYRLFADAAVRPIVLSGDSHAFWVNDLRDAAGRQAAVEFGTSAISSPSPGDALPGFPLGEALAERNAEVLHCDQQAKGFILLTLTRDRAEAELHAVSTIVAKPFETRVTKRFTVPASPSNPPIVEA